MNPETQRMSETNPQKFFSDISEKYVRETSGKENYLTTTGRIGRTLKVLSLLDQYQKVPCTIADIGCGPGHFANPIIERGHTYIGMDINENMFSECSKTYEGDERVTYKYGAIEAIPLPDESIDCLICVGVVEYIKGDTVALKEINRVLKKSGIAIITYPSLWNPINLFRMATRPILAPILRVLLPQLKETVYVSGILHRTIRPDRLKEKAKSCGLQLLFEKSDGHAFSLVNHQAGSFELKYRQWCEKWGSKLFPKLGSNFYSGFIKN